MATAATSRPSGPVLSIPSYRSASPTRVKVAAGSGARSPAKSVSVASPSASSAAAKSRTSCMCSPTNHPGSFRCSLHKERRQEGPVGHDKPASPSSPSSSASSLGGTCRMDAKRTGGALARVGGASESRTWARKALAPSPQSPHRRRASAGGSFRPRPSRLSAVSFAGDRAGDNRR
uniref:Uncharacterized protein n=1 Tax=Avena sativa TaxID=4498 RepID=A0ACD5YUV7_AVESA